MKFVFGFDAGPLCVCVECFRILLQRCADIIDAKLKRGHFHNDDSDVNKTSGAWCFVKCIEWVSSFTMHETSHIGIVVLRSHVPLSVPRTHTEEQCIYPSRVSPRPYHISVGCALLFCINVAACEHSQSMMMHSYRWCMWHHRMTISQNGNLTTVWHDFALSRNHIIRCLLQHACIVRKLHEMRVLSTHLLESGDTSSAGCKRCAHQPVIRRIHRHRMGTEEPHNNRLVRANDITKTIFARNK